MKTVKQRVLKSPLTRYERMLLDRLLIHTPARVTPDMLTALGTFGALVTLVGYVLTWLSPAYLWLASFGLALHWLGDSLDGNLARHRRIERPRYGFFIDQTIDVIGNLLIAIGIGISAYVRLDVALLTLTGYHMLSIYSFVRACITNEFHVTVLNSGPTEVRIMIVIMNILILLLGAPQFMLFGQLVTWCDLTMILMACIFIAGFIHLVADYARILRAEDAAHARHPQSNGS